jgi:hypothetical protein
MHGCLSLRALGLVLLCAPLTARAQILNVEKKRLERKESEFLVGNLGVNFNYNNRSPTLREPVRVMSTGARSNVGYFAGPHGYLLINQYQLLLINDSEIVNTGFTHARVQLYRDDVLSFELFSQYQFDRPRGLGLRWLTGAGPRYRLLQSPKLNLTAGSGAMYELETWEHPFVEDLVVTVRAVKSSVYVSTRIEFDERIDFNGVVYHQAGYDRGIEALRQRVSGELNLNVKLVRWLSLVSSFAASYETHPIVPIIPFIFETANGVQLEF